MRVIHTGLADAVILEPDAYEDSRGLFFESYNQKAFAEQGIGYTFIQDNHSYSAEAGTLRGLHYQLKPKAQTKLVRVLVGAIYDVFVDLRKDSPTFGQWGEVILTAANRRQVLIPQGFAHGFCTLVPHTEVLYKVDEMFSKEHDRGILWNDPTLHIPWPSTKVVTSDKDKVHPLLHEADYDF
ncbi:dTDP-4-dehydrorhamnose 3,5-epimerase [Paenibacillus shirakamiensis]|uniref:dTDP-4-dehydrorhamnose 3,5-epimerase n=1 Tax=Paenibacillus shirakamiensis TaxID=1265935 RepID=A0ABS4JG71_9BACL|nr:dTDP-4-dehydrorhamnose 3,5-epimerase [Paenibacillus shirakamiensis]MBP2000702.1 dTDP-4-dehydrorhamnose 3,5-epimerase [Paenibacillus shirakamiensis]